MVLNISIKPLKSYISEKSVTYRLTLSDNTLKTQYFMESLKRMKKSLKGNYDSQKIIDSFIIDSLLKFSILNVQKQEYINLDLPEFKEQTLFKYPVILEFTVNKREKRELDENMALLLDAHNKSKKFHSDTSMNSDLQILLHSLTFAEENQDLFDDFITKTLSNLDNDKKQTNGLHEDYSDPNNLTPKCCFVCGSEISSSATFNVFSSEKIQNSVCQKCIKFSEMSSNMDVSTWKCQVQQIHFNKTKNIQVLV